MKKRIIYVIAFFLVVLLAFVMQKPFFMLYNDTFSAGLPLSDYVDVITHGLTLDCTMSGFLVAIPFLVTFVSIWYNKISLKKIMLPYYILVALTIGIVLVVDTSLYEFWNFKLDATVLFYLDSPSNAAASVSTGFIALRVFVILLIAAAITWLLMLITPRQFEPIKNKKILNSFIMLLFGGVIFIVLRGGATESTPNVGRVYYSDNQFLNHSAVNPYFSFFYSISKSENFADQFNFFDEAERAAIFDGLYPEKEGTTEVHLLTTDRPNVLIILLESFTANFVEVLGGEPDVTPNLNRLSEEGVFFTNYYSSSFRTDRGIICAFSGFPGLPTTSIMKMPVKSQTMPSIAHNLARVGYKSDLLYGGDIDYSNMRSYFQSTGYQKMTYDKHFSFKEQHTHAWGVNDDITFEYLYNVIKDRKDYPWHTAFITLSSHDPFIVPFNKFENKVTNSMAYTDDCFGKFIDKLKETPAWDDLLIICLPDHGYCYPKHINKHDPIFFYAPMLWLGGAVKEPVKIDKMLNQTDIAATLLGQLNLPHDDFEYSRDIFSSSYTYPFAFFSYNNGFGFRDSTGVSIYDNTPDMVILEEPSPSADRVNKGKAILQTLYDDLGSR